MVNFSFGSPIWAQKNGKAISDEQDVVSFSSLVKMLYEHGYDRTFSNYSQQLAQSKKNLSRQSYMTSIEIAPYEQATKLRQNGVDAGDVKTQGLRFSVAQSTPWGVSLVASADQKQFNAVSAVAQIESEKSIGVTLDLWKNILGTQSRSLDESRLFEARSLEIQSEMEQRSACESATNLAMEYWLAFNNLQQAKELQNSAASIAKSVEKTKQRGVISQIEYLGAQSELLNTDRELLGANLRLEQAIRRIVSSLQIDQKNTEFVSSILNGDSIQSPSETLTDIASRFLSLKSAETLIQTNTQLVYESRVQLAKAAEQASKPTVQVGFKQIESKGETASIDFSQADQIVELALKMNINDSTTKVAEVDAHVQLLKADLEFSKARQNTALELSDVQSKIKNQMSSLKLQEKQIALLGRIKDDYQVRFLQGRINYQDYLRQKQSWSMMRTTVLSESVETWRSVVKAYLSLDAAHNFCEKL